MTWEGPKTLDRRFLEFEERHLGFAGVYLDERGLVIQVTAGSFLPDVPLETLKDDLAEIIGRDRERLAARKIRFQVVEYDFRTLDRWRNAVRSIDTGGRLLALDVDERVNRVRIGVSDSAAEAVIRSALPELRIPDAAVIVEAVVPVRPGLSLRDRRRPVPGSMQLEYVNAPSQIATCTIGFNAWLGGVRGFVTASHCSPTMASRDSNDYWQNSGTTFNNLIAYEYQDPSAYSCTMDGQSASCRDSDANFAKYYQTDTWDFPRMAVAFEGSLTIQSFEDVVCHSCGGIGVGDTVVRQGRRTGREEGAVTASCVDRHNPDDDIWLRCQNEVRAFMSEGDSGGPVFTLPSGGGVWLHGIAWGFDHDNCPYSCRYVYSPMVNIEWELGFLIAEEGM